MELQGEARLERYPQADVHHAHRRVERYPIPADRLPVQPRLPRGARHARNAHPRDVHARRVPEVPLHGELAGLVREGDRGGRRLRHGHAVVEVERAGGGPVRRGRDDELEIGLAQLRRRHGGGAAAQGDDDAAAQEEGQVRQVEAVEVHGGAAAARGRERVPVVELVVGQVDVDGGGVLLEDRGNEKRRAVEELGIDGEGGGVRRVEVEKGVQGGGAIGGLPPQRRVEVIEQAVADGDGGARPFYIRRKRIRSRRSLDTNR